ncbi:MAG: hypothetical protein CM15mP88_3170 [Pseudomonadota bacterium]|nr:MAG: hypothetical protein CM15mP88_3170 [Pseudomonadota bacterium]
MQFGKTRGKRLGNAFLQTRTHNLCPWKRATLGIALMGIDCLKGGEPQVVSLLAGLTTPDGTQASSVLSSFC